MHRELIVMHYISGKTNSNVTDDVGTLTSAKLFSAYYPLILVIVGTIINLLTFAVLCRSVFRDTERRATLHYMRVISIFDILMLYGWNLDALQTYTIASCKFVSFLNHFASQVSAWLRVFITLDRYLASTRVHRTWFGRSKSVLLIIGFVMLFFTLFNFHFLLFACYYTSDGSISNQGTFYQLYPTMEIVHFVVYNCIPFLLMVIFNGGTIYHMHCVHNAARIQNRHYHQRAISFALILLTFLFSIMTMPATIIFGFFVFETSEVLQNSFDSLLYTYHVIEFPIYFAVLAEFRRETLLMIRCIRKPAQVRPIVPHTTQATQQIQHHSHRSNTYFGKVNTMHETGH